MSNKSSFSMRIGHHLMNHLACVPLDDPDSAGEFRAWGEILSKHSKQFLSLANEIERENSKGAGIHFIQIITDYGTSFRFYGNPDALKRLADKGLFEDITEED
jgi:hypothetical protein